MNSEEITNLKSKTAKLRAIIEKYPFLTSTKYCRLIGIDSSLIYRVKTGQTQYLSPENFEKIYSGVDILDEASKMLNNLK